jgi:hypothetical protein
MMTKDPEASGRKVMEEAVISIIPEKNPPRFDSSKLVCFMCGGLSQSEICSIRRDPSLNSVLLASDLILSPAVFVDSLRSIDILSK